MQIRGPYLGSLPDDVQTLVYPALLCNIFLLQEYFLCAGSICDFLEERGKAPWFCKSSFNLCRPYKTAGNENQIELQKSLRSGVRLPIFNFKF